ncbi:hypothetical protein KW811_22115 [Enterobacter quasiroggenkampii]|uniref:hypothetical protein n=1 Tax=Enterobacter quasiroggenkampii TaxID=2497436 RepID=UPI0021D0E00F|nr:hypothetical protein [Enterobacter quasiroggenkampii]MCU6401183.1 hypothetical protein [Enterobacter quasiroggenkampii]
MAKLPKKVVTSDEAKETTLRDFVSTAAHKPTTGSKITRVNLSLTDEDLDGSEALQRKLNLSRVEIFRAGLVALSKVSESEQQTIADEIRRLSPKAGRPPVNR